MTHTPNDLPRHLAVIRGQATKVDRQIATSIAEVEAVYTHYIGKGHTEEQAVWLTEITLNNIQEDTNE